MIPTPAGIEKRRRGKTKTLDLAMRRCGAPQHGLSSNKNGPNHLGLWYNVLPWHQMALITSGLCARRRGSVYSAGIMMEDDETEEFEGDLGETLCLCPGLRRWDVRGGLDRVASSLQSHSLDEAPPFPALSAAILAKN